MMKWNASNPTAAPKIGVSMGEKPPPGRYVFEFQVAKGKTSENKIAKMAGQHLVIFEFTIAAVLTGGEPSRDWKGNTRTAPLGARRSFVLNMSTNQEKSLQQLNELCPMLHGIDSKNPKELRDHGLSPKDDSREEIIRSSEEMDQIINNVVDSVENPLLGVRIECECKDVENEKVLQNGTVQKNTFTVYNFARCSRPEDIEHNEKVLAA